MSFYDDYVDKAHVSVLVLFNLIDGTAASGDSYMATLPNAVQRQIDAANQLLTVANQPAETTQPADQVQPDQTQEPTAQVVEHVPEASPAPAPQPPRDDWQQKYQILQGKYNAEVPALHHQVKDLTRKLTETVDRVEQVAKAKETERQQAQTALDPRDVENFGSDLVDMVRRVSQQMLGGVAAKVDGVVQGFEQRLATVEHQLQGTSQAVAVTAEQSFYDRVAKLVPDWESVNQEQAFLTWLGEVDPVYGQPRQVALNQASKDLNADRAAAVFNAYKSLKPKAPAKTPLDKQVSPRAVASAAPQAQVGKTTLTEAQIVQYYAAKRRGEYTPAQIVEYDQMINEAIAEGRVR